MKTLLVYSGGMDSTVLLYWLMSRGHKVETLSFNYGQRHMKELQAAETIASNMGVPHKTMRVSIPSNSTLSGVENGDIPKGHYEDESMRSTVVAGRNLLFLSNAFVHARQFGFDSVAIGVHQGDHAIYPDCRPAFVSAMTKVFQVSDYGGVRLLSPFLQLTKTDIAKLAIQLSVPLANTWTCYVGGEEPCGSCGSCFERNEALAGAEA